MAERRSVRQWLTSAAMIGVSLILAAALLPASPAAASGSEGVTLTAVQARQLDDRIDAALARVPGGKRIGVNEVAWADGNVVMTFGVADGKVGARAYGACDSGWYCIYEAWYWNNYDRGLRKLRFRDCTSQGYHNDLYNWGFDNRTSSWDNRSRAGVEVYDYFGRYLFLMSLGARAAEVPAGTNDRAVHMYAYCW